MIAALVIAGSALLACGSNDDGSSPGPAELFPDVVDVEITAEGDGSYTIAATLSSPYDSPERYADAWRVLDENGNELGVRELTHDHADEQPFTRRTTVSIPDDVDEVTVEGRDQVSGYGGETVTVAVPRGESAPGRPNAAIGLDVGHTSTSAPNLDVRVREGSVLASPTDRRTRRTARSSGGVAPGLPRGRDRRSGVGGLGDQAVVEVVVDPA